MYLPRHTYAFLLLLLAVPLAAAAQQTQELPGLDHSAPPQKPQQQRPPPPTPPPATPGTAQPPPSTREAAPLAPGEADVAFADRVKAVQRKGFLKRQRFELGIDFPFTVNDPFYEKLGVGGKLAYNIDDSFAVAVRGTYFWSLRTDAVRQGQLAFSSLLLNSPVYGQVMGDFVWSPVYGKVAWLGSSIVHFDLNLMAGLGLVWSGTSVAPRSEGPHFATDLGAGIRFYPRSWLSLDGGVVATLYPDQPSLAVPSTIQKLITVRVGLTFFLPTTFEYVYP